MPAAKDAEITYDLSLLEQSQDKWKKSEGLRLVYGDFYREIRDSLIPGPTLELGSGIGASREFIPGVVTSDLIQTPFVDIACSAYDISLHAEGKWSNIIALDVLHHLCRPMDFFASASAALCPGGRIIMIEPSATLFATVFYKLFHKEPIQKHIVKPPFVFTPNAPDGTFANMAMGTVMFHAHVNETEGMLSNYQLEIDGVRFRDVLAYPLTGGYSSSQLAPGWLLNSLLAVEKILPQWILRLVGLRMVVVIQKLPRTTPRQY